MLPRLSLRRSRGDPKHRLLVVKKLLERTMHLVGDFPLHQSSSTRALGAQGLEAGLNPGKT